MANYIENIAGLSPLETKDPIAHMKDCINEARAIEDCATERDTLFSKRNEENKHLDDEYTFKVTEAEIKYAEQQKVLASSKNTLMSMATSKFDSVSSEVDTIREKKNEKAKQVCYAGGISVLGIICYLFGVSGQNSHDGCSSCFTYLILLIGVITLFPAGIAFMFLLTVFLINLAIYNNANSKYQKARKDFDLAKQEANSRYEDDLKIANYKYTSFIASLKSDIDNRRKMMQIDYENRINSLELSILDRHDKLIKSIQILDKGTICGTLKDQAWDNWSTSDIIPDCLRIGTIKPKMPHFDMQYPNNVKIEIPLLVDYRNNNGIVIHADGLLGTARYSVQNAILRLLATIPPAGVKFVFIDPVSLGGNVAGFMSLEKYEASLIGGKAWSDSRHIEEALSEITDHMETVIQKYLREDFKTIADYNAQSRVKESYRILAVFDFPANFNESSTKRLVSIMRNGPRCGVFPIIVIDDKKPLPYGFSLNDLEQQALTMYPQVSIVQNTSGKDMDDDENDKDDEDVDTTSDEWDEEEDYEDNDE